MLKMSYAKRFRALGLSFVAVLGLAAVMAAGAQGNWLVAGKELSVEVKKEFRVGIHNSKLPILLVISQKLEIDCHEITGKDLLIEGTGAANALASGKLSFNNCLTTQNGVRQKGCDPSNQPINVGSAVHVILHNGHEYVELRLVTLIEFNPATCALVEDSEIDGKLVAECLTSDLKGLSEVLNPCLKEEKVHLLREHPTQSLFKTGLFFGESPAALDGVLKVELTSEEAWCAHV